MPPPSPGVEGVIAELALEAGTVPPVRGSPPRTPPATPNLAPVKALKLGTPRVTRPRSVRTPQVAVGTAAASKASRAMAAATGPRQREEAAVEDMRATVTRDAQQGREQARTVSRRGRGPRGS
jgi:hypothetical protein